MGQVLLLLLNLFRIESGVDIVMDLANKNVMSEKSTRLRDSSARVQSGSADEPRRTSNDRILGQRRDTHGAK